MNNESTEETPRDTGYLSNAMRRLHKTSSGVFGWWISVRHRIVMGRSYVLVYVGVLLLLGGISSLYHTAGCSIEGRAVLCPTEGILLGSRENAYSVPWYNDMYMYFEAKCPMYPPLVALEHEEERKGINRREEMEQVMQEKIPWIAFVGDSIARNVLLSLLIQVGAGDAKTITFERHADFEYLDPEGRFKATLHWAPFPDNATTIMTSWTKKSRAKIMDKPSAVVLSVSLWHILHMHDVALFEQEISILRLAMIALDTNTFVANAPEVFPTLLQDPKKQRYMVPQRIDAYNKVLTESLFLNDNTNGTSGVIVLLDVFNTTILCGETCSVDGIHSKDLVYTTLVHSLWYTVRTCF